MPKSKTCAITARLVNEINVLSISRRALSLQSANADARVRVKSSRLKRSLTLGRDSIHVYETLANEKA